MSKRSTPAHNAQAATRARFLAQPVLSEAAALKFMNEVQRHAVVVDGGQTGVITIDFDEELQRSVLRRSTFDDIKHRYANQLVKFKVKTGAKTEARFKALGVWWLAAFGRRQYQRVVFDPSDHCGVDSLNLWTGFGVESDPSGDWSLLREHVFNVVCRREDARFNYVMDWLRFGVQHPDRLPETSLVLLGREGIGKGLPAREFLALFGTHGLQVSNARLLTGPFNAHLQNVVALFLDEAILPTDQQAKAIVHSLITEPAITIEGKYRTPVVARNVCHLLIASNERKAVPVNLDARRYCVLDVSDARRGDEGYFAAIVKQMQNGGRGRMLHDLLNEPIRSELRTVPQTQALVDLKLQSMDAAHRWWLERLHEGRLLPGDSCWRTEVLRSLLTDSYTAAVGRSHGDSRGGATELGLFLKSVLPETAAPQTRQRTVTLTDVPPEQRIVARRGVQRFWVLPSLEACRTSFERLMRTPIRWGADDAKSVKQDVKEERRVV